MALGRRNRDTDQPAPPARVETPAPRADIDKYADEPYVSPSVKAAREGKQVNFGTDIFAGDHNTDTD